MGWSLGYDEKWKRDIGYGVPAKCDHPGCDEEIDRGLSFVCGNEPYGGEHGCGLYFCSKHHAHEHQTCDRCERGEAPFEPSDDVQEWVQHKLTDKSWKPWRDVNPELVKFLTGK